MILTDFYIALLARLEDKAPMIEFADLWSGQLIPGTEDEEDLPFPLPAAFIEFDNWPLVSLAKNRQNAPVTFTLHIGSECMNDASLRELKEENGKENLKSALFHLECIQQAIEALHGYSVPDYFGTIQALNILPDSSFRNVYYYKVQFTCLIIDLSKKKRMIHPNPTPNLRTT